MFFCQSCEYNTKRKFNLQIHIQSKHHRDATDAELTRISQNTENSSQSTEMFPTNNTNASPFFQSNNLACQKCSKVFKTSHGLKNHQKICSGVSNILECLFCHKVFATYQTKSKHLKTCKIKAAQEQVNKFLEQHNTDSTNNIISNNTNNTNNTNNCMNNQIIYQFNNYRISNNNYKNMFDEDLDGEDISNINDFGQEDISYISNEVLQEFAMKHQLRDFIMEKHFNIDHPENHNIRSNGSKSFKVLKKRNWTAQPREVIFSTIYNNTKSQLFDVAYNQVLPNLDEDKKDQYLSIVEQYDKFFKKSAYKTIDVQVEELMKKRRQHMIANHNLNNAFAIQNPNILHITQSSSDP